MKFGSSGTLQWIHNCSAVKWWYLCCALNRNPIPDSEDHCSHRAGVQCSSEVPPYWLLIEIWLPASLYLCTQHDHMQDGKDFLANEAKRAKIDNGNDKIPEADETAPEETKAEA